MGNNSQVSAKDIPGWQKKVKNARFPTKQNVIVLVVTGTLDEGTFQAIQTCATPPDSNHKLGIGLSSRFWYIKTNTNLERSPKQRSCLRCRLGCIASRIQKSDRNTSHEAQKL